MATWMKLCKNCIDFNLDKEECMIRYVISKDNTRTPMKRKANQKGCYVFILKELTNEDEK